MDKFLVRSNSNPNVSGKRPGEPLDNEWRTPKRSAPAATPLNKPITPTSNRFEGLQKEKPLEPNPPELRAASERKKSGHIPPILLDLQPDWTHNSVKDIISKLSKNFHLQYRGNNKVAIHCYSPDVHQLIKTGLRDEKIPFFTFSRRDEKLRKCVIRGLPPIDVNELSSELISLGFNDTKVTRMGAKPDSPFYCPPYLVQLPEGEDILRFRKIKYICNCSVEIRKYKPNSSAGTQCFRCQAFGHASRNCNLPARCVKCTEAHPTSECTKKDRSSPAQCCNCNEFHAANYSKCSARTTYVQRLAKQRNKQQIVPIQPHAANSGTIQSSGPSWADIASSQPEPIRKSQRENPGGNHQDTTTNEMLQILSAVKVLKERFSSCVTMVDKVILILTYLDKHF